MSGLGMTMFATSVGLLGYIGPGPGLSMLGALIGLIVTVVTAIGAVLLWPLRAMLGSNDDEEESEEGASEGESAESAERDDSAETADGDGASDEDVTSAAAADEGGDAKTSVEA